MVEHFVHLLALKNRVARPSLSRDMLGELERRPWYGNCPRIAQCDRACDDSLARRQSCPRISARADSGGLSFTANVIQEEAIMALVRQWAQAQLESSEPGREPPRAIARSGRAAALEGRRRTLPRPSRHRRPPPRTAPHHAPEEMGTGMGLRSGDKGDRSLGTVPIFAAERARRSGPKGTGTSFGRQACPQHKANWAEK